MNHSINALRAGGQHQAGFILIYTLWVLAAASIALALYAKSPSNSARVGERQFSAAIELPETVNVLDYVLAHSVSQEREIDARFITYRQQLDKQSVQTGRNLVRELKEILSQIGMELNIPDDSQTGINVITEKTEQDQQRTSDTVKVRQGRIFGPSKEEKTLHVGKSTYKVQVQPGNAKVNLNTMARGPLTRYLVYLGLPEDSAMRLAAVIHDWVDADDFLSDYGAEFGQYPFQQGPRNGPLQTWDEVSYLKGANAQLVEFLREHFTLHDSANAVRVHADYFTPEALAAITDLQPEQIKVALELHALPSDEQVPLGELIGEEEAARFQELVGWDADNQILLIRVSGALTGVSAVFDTANQQLLDWYLWR